MVKNVGVTLFLVAGCFTDTDDHKGFGGDTAGDTVGDTEDGTAGDTGDGTDLPPGTSGGGETGGDGGGASSSAGTTDQDESTAVDTTDGSDSASGSSDTSGESGSSGTGFLCPDGMAFNQGYCWAVAACDVAACSVGGDAWCGQSNIDTCAAYGLEPTPTQILLPEWTEEIAEGISDQLGLSGVEETGNGCCYAVWNSTWNTIRAYGYGLDREYTNRMMCIYTSDAGGVNLYYYWPIHTCFPL